MEATFQQDYNGLNDRGDPVRYDFNGDDDLWIYIDGVKILDIGGVHDAFNGHIDFVTGQLFLPIVGFLTCIFIGWFVPHKVVREEFTNWGTLRNVGLFHFYLFLVKYVCPICILFIFLHQFGLL